MKKEEQEPRYTANKLYNEKSVNIRGIFAFGKNKQSILDNSRVLFLMLFSACEDT
jgi:hypothetical protein